MLDRRIYRHAQSGEQAELRVERVTGPGGALWWSVALVLTETGKAAIPALPAIEWWPTRDQARAGYRARLRALRKAGWRRAEAAV